MDSIPASTSSIATTATPPRFQIADGTIESLKWLALGLMTVDHINKYLFAEKLPAAYELGRMAMPLFAFVLAHNLARPGTLASGAYGRTMKRLALSGALATPFFIGLGYVMNGWWPLNILFMLLASTLTFYLVEKGGHANCLSALVIFVVGGALVEFWWFAMAFCFCAWRYCKSRSTVNLAVWMVVGASLYLVNSNFWALAAFPIILASQGVTIRIPRLRHVFYAYYPAHLAVLLIVSTYLVKHA